MIFDIGIHAFRVPAQEPFFAFRHAVIEDPGRLRQVDGPYEDVDVEGGPADHFREPSLGQELEADHLGQPVRGIGVAYGIDEIIDALRLDEGDSHIVPADGGRLVES